LALGVLKAAHWQAELFCSRRLKAPAKYQIYRDLVKSVPGLWYLGHWFFPPIEINSDRCEYACRTLQGTIGKKQRNLLGRISHNMQEIQVKARSESQTIDKPVQISKTRFDDAEYERWSEKIRSRNGSKGK
jgi:hypothetical protein